jgi:hypothetical protein
VGSAQVLARVLQAELIVDRQAAALLIMKGALVAFAFDLARDAQIHVPIQ